MESYCMHFTVIWFFIYREVFWYLSLPKHVILGPLFLLLSPSIAFQEYIPNSFFSLLGGYLDCSELFFSPQTTQYWYSSCLLTYLAKWEDFLNQGSSSEPQNSEDNCNDYFLKFPWMVCN